MAQKQAVTYSFESVSASIVGPNGAFPLGFGAMVSAEGITIERSEPKSDLQVGADGSFMHVLHAGKPGRITARFLKNSPTNALLSAMYNADTNDPASHGQNTILVTEILTGDVTTGIGAGFMQAPTNTYSREGPMLEWTWLVGMIDDMLGAGV